MSVGLYLVGAALGGCATLLVAGRRAQRHAFGRADRLVYLSALATFALLTAALVLLLAKFLLVDLSTYYVWRYTHADHPWYYRLSGLWAGQPGTLLLWAWYASLCLALTQHLAQRRKATAQQHSTNLLSAMLLALLVGTLSALALQQGLFDATSDYRVQSMQMDGMVMREYVRAPGAPGETPTHVFPQGLGLNPLLLTPFMVIHPWIEFAAYGLVTLLFSILIAQLRTRDESATLLALPIARITWIVYTTAIGLGALWAYYTLSFGGYWAWDPVETANLLPWLALTAYLHVAPLHKRHGIAPRLAPVLGILSFPLTLLATFLTRSGVWNGSVHAFITEGDLDVQDAGQRLATILDQDPTIARLLSLLLGASLLVNLVLLHRERQDARRGRPLLNFILTLTWALFIWTILNPATLLDAFLAASRATPIPYPVAASLFASLALVGPGLYLYLHEDGPTSGTKLRLDHKRTLLAVGLTLLLICVVSLVLLLRGINGTQRIVYDQRAPLFALALALLLTLHFLRKTLRPAHVFAALATASLLGIAAAILWPQQRLVAIAAPFVLLALASLLLAHERAAPPVHWRLRVARILLTLAGILGVVLWANPPPHVELLGAQIHLTPPLIALGFAGSVANLLAASFVAHARRGMLARALATFGLVAYGYGLGALLTTSALLLARRPCPTIARERSSWRTELHRSTLTLLHASVLLAMLGYGLSTYAAADQAYTTDAPLQLGERSDFGDYSLTFTGTTGTDTDKDGVLENVDAYIEVHRGEDLVTNATLSMFFVPSKDHYDPSTTVTRGAREDIYFNANFQNAHAMYSDEDGWTRGHGPTTEVHSAAITKLALNVRILPYTSLLWSGILLGLYAMALRTLTRPRASGSHSTPAASPTTDTDPLLT